MPLPKPVLPEYSTTIPSTGRKIKYQPFTVREEKILMLASESNSPEETANAVSNVLKKCITSPSDVDVESLALFDIEYLFLKTRAKSIGEKITVIVRDPNDESFSKEHEINIDKIQVEKNPDHTDLITLDDTVTVKMRYPGISFFHDGISLDDIEQSSDLIAKCVNQIIIDEEVYASQDMSLEEVKEWLDGLTVDKFRKISEFFTTMPKLKHSITVKNTNTNKNFTVVMEGLADFF